MSKEEIAVKEYEISYLAQEENGADLVRALIVREGGEIFFEDPAERITPAYKIAKQSQAYFGWFHFRIVPEVLPALNNELRNKSGILRYLIVTPPFVKNRPKSVSKPKQKPPAAEAELKPVVPQVPLSNEALERKIEEILRE